MPRKNESKIVDELKEWARNKNGELTKYHGSPQSRRGEPDLDGFVEHLGRTVHVKFEVKIPGEELRLLQKHRLNVYQKAGYCAGVVTCVEDAEGMVDDWVRAGKWLSN
jgi:hypothetical protein